MANNTSSSPVDWGVGIIVGIVMIAGMTLWGLVEVVKFILKRRHREKAQAKSVQDFAGAPSPVPSVSTDVAATALALPAITNSPQLRELTLPVRQSSSTESTPGVADRNIVLHFNESFSGTASVFLKDGVIRGKLRVVSRPAADAMRDVYNTERFDLPEQSLVGQSFEMAMANLERSGLTLIRQLLKQPSLDQLPQVEQAKSPAASLSEDAVKVALDVLRREMLGAQSARPAEVSESAAIPVPTEITDVKVQRNPIGVHRGVVKGYRHRPMFGANGGTTFELTLSTDAGKELTLTGLQLRDLLREHDVAAGDFVEVESLGKTQLPGGKNRNEYSMKVIKRAATA